MQKAHVCAEIAGMGFLYAACIQDLNWIDLFIEQPFKKHTVVSRNRGGQKF